MQATGKLIAAVLAAGAAGTVLTGCGGDKDASAAPVVRAAATTTGTAAEPFAGDTGQQLLKKAEAAMTTVSAVTIDLRTTGDDDESVHATIAVTASGRCAATADDGGKRFQIIRTGSVYYMRAGADFWTSEGGPDARTLAKLAGGKWVKLPESAEKDGGFDMFCDLNTLLDSAKANDGKATSVTKGRPTAYDGGQVVPLIQKYPADDQDDEDTTLYIAATGAPYILKAFTPGDSTNVMTFSRFGRAPVINPPPAGQIVDLSAAGPGFTI
ncbi:hypothetical protein GA0115240_10022 [Streptomyces sp. DvalAA-14]|uniref:hypothetical protein n=1 Tax=unclassified Streptomyces TaxID=2593676 RepID=UPI00081AFEAA|nr:MULTISPECIES: hypothetical protein [unclassified Streptomyces]MYS18687.1 hypothetical protein [Streptomyces sp. SID4948]SCD27590.1 hypothetical protein GA0115240_10022 [Streptomyces sp. DvalAA-14]